MTEDERILFDEILDIWEELVEVDSTRFTWDHDGDIRDKEKSIELRKCHLSFRQKSRLTKIRKKIQLDENIARVTKMRRQYDNDVDRLSEYKVFLQEIEDRENCPQAKEIWKQYQMTLTLARDHEKTED